MPRFRYLGNAIANNIAGRTWLPGDEDDVSEEFGVMLREWPDAWLEIKNLINLNAPVQHTGDTDETAPWSFTLPANPYGLKAMLRITALLKHIDPEADNTSRALRIRVDDVASGGIAISGSYTNQLGALVLGHLFITEDGLEGYVAWAPGSGTGALTNLAVDWSTAHTIYVTIDLADADDTVQIREAYVEVIPGNPT